MRQEQLFYIEQPEQQVAGPYDLVQMASLLRNNVITSETLTCLEGKEEWKPFSWYPQFIVAQEMSPHAESKRVIQLNEAATTPRSVIPLPSADFFVKAVCMLALLVLAGLGVYFVAREDTTTGIFLTVGGVAAALLGTCMIYVKVADEGYITLLMVLLIPFFDVYFFLSRFWDYVPYFCLKYLGAIFIAAALAGIASLHPEEMGGLQTILSFYGL